MNENQVGVILEEVRDMFKTLAEGQQVIEERLCKVEEGQQILEKGQRDLELGQKALLSRQMALEKDMKEVKSELKTIQLFVMSADETFNNYDDRIKVLEKKTAHL